MAGMRVALLVSGSRGDFQPFLGVALELRKAGHVVKFYTSRDHCTMATEFDFSSIEISKEIEPFVTGGKCKAAMESGDWGQVVFKVRQETQLDEAAKEPEKFFDRMAADLREFKPDILLWNGIALTMLFEAVALAIPDVPRINAELQPQVLPSNTYKCLSYGGDLPDEETPPVLTFLWSCGMTDEQVECYQKAFAAKESKEAIFKKMDSMDPPELCFEQQFEPDKWLAPRVLAYSGSFRPNPEDWPKSDNIIVTGCLKVSKEIQDECTKRGSKYFSVGSEYQQCEEFIAKVGAPVYIGWGSMMVYTKEHMTLLAVEAVKRAGVKAIILSGWARVDMDGLTGAPNEQELRDWCKENVLFIKAAPHDLLLPQCCAAVHHGGIGTTQASVGAGCPTVVTPVFSDQFDNGSHVAKIGCGVTTTRLGLLKSDELGDAIKTVCSEAKYKANATAMSAAMAKEDGAAYLVSWMTKFYNEEVKTGKYQEKKLANKERLYALRQKHNKFSMGQLMSKYQSGLMSRFPEIKAWNISNMKFMATAADVASKGKLWWIQGASVLARSGEGLKTPEAGRFKRYAFVEELEKKGSRVHVRKLKGKGPDQGWITTSVKGKEMASAITEAAEIGKVTQMQYDELFSNFQGGGEADGEAAA